MKKARLNIIYRTKVKGFRSWAFLMISGLAQVIEGLSIIVSGGTLTINASEGIETRYLETAMKGLTVKKDEGE
jgi:hypothetical protein